jgi:hypothetical protein
MTSTNESRMQGGCKNYKIIGSSLIDNCRNLQDLLSAVLANMWWSLSVISRNGLHCQSGVEYALIDVHQYINIDTFYVLDVITGILS